MEYVVWQQLHFRPPGTTAPALPASARSVGHQLLSAGFDGHPGRRAFVCLLWGIAGQAQARLSEAWWPFGAGQVMVYRAQDDHHIRVLSGTFECRWVTIDGPLATALFDALAVAQGPRDVGPCPAAEFTELLAVIERNTAEAARRAAVLAYQILTAVAGSAENEKSRHPVAAQCVNLIHQRLADPNLNIKTLAQAVAWHRSSLSRLFKQETGSNPASYIQTLRQQHALRALQETGRPIAQVARDCGYTDPEYFARAFRRLTHVSPREFRKRLQRAVEM